ncbi:hypothetical protein SRA_09988 [Streptococcus ratti FA-1 = DSM 20564]|uniref:Uncharacterized protein n=1 Tax=Streptococcus ratti FA-1 = DSM 20564 TaxID=699248 RepID=A0ABN0GSF4_STRRT|nr:hypothetical protein SRA_09988 [Streptococcus ratti FA-1 = DSM 20564]
MQAESLPKTIFSAVVRVTVACATVTMELLKPWVQKSGMELRKEVASVLAT